MSEVIKPVILNETGIRIAKALEGRNGQTRVLPLSGSDVETSNVVVAVGTPAHLDDVTPYADYGITETGWYVFARILAKEGGFVSVEGAAGYIAEVGGDHVDVAVRFEVAAMSKVIDVDWGVYTERFVFQAPDLAVRNLDYRVTFYVYDAADFVTWHYGLATGTFTEGTRYFAKAGETYEETEVTAGETIPAYYTYQSVYVLTTNTTFQDGVEYYTRDGENYTLAEVTVGEAVEANTYYVTTMAYVQAEGGKFQAGTVYYIMTGSTYDEAAVTVGDEIPAYYVHSKVTIEGLVRNVTYRLDEIVDCPMEFILPEIEDDTHGAWFEIRCRHAGAYSMTLVPPEGVKIATEHTQKEAAGINMINLHYTAVDGVKVWRFMNTHSSIPA